MVENQVITKQYCITILISIHYIKNAVIIAQNDKKCAILFGLIRHTPRVCVCVCVFALNGMHTYKIHKYNKSVQFAQI